ncbi:MAG: nickel insertion protein, partial [Anaerolineae bacterium]
LRRQEIERLCLPRTIEQVETPWGPVRVKIAHLPNGQRKAAPEYEDCQALAAQHGVPLRTVYQAASAKA